MQSALMWADMFIKLGLVSGSSEYCRRQSRPCGARGEGARDTGRDREQECARERPCGGWSTPRPAVLFFSPLVDKVIRHQRATILFLYLFGPQSGFRIINPKAILTFLLQNYWFNIEQHWCYSPNKLHSWFPSEVWLTPSLFSVCILVKRR